MACYPCSITGHRGRNPEPNETIPADLSRRGKLRHDDDEEHCGSNDVGREICFVSHAPGYRHRTTMGWRQLGKSFPHSLLRRATQAYVLDLNEWSAR